MSRTRKSVNDARCNFALPSTLLDDVDRVAGEDGMDRSEWLRYTLRQTVDRHDRKAQRTPAGTASGRGSSG